MISPNAEKKNELAVSKNTTDLAAFSASKLVKRGLDLADLSLKGAPLVKVGEILLSILMLDGEEDYFEGWSPFIAARLLIQLQKNLDQIKSRMMAIWEQSPKIQEKTNALEVLSQIGYCDFASNQLLEMIEKATGSLNSLVSSEWPDNKIFLEFHTLLTIYGKLKTNKLANNQYRGFLEKIRRLKINEDLRAHILKWAIEALEQQEDINQESAEFLASLTLSYPYIVSYCCQVLNKYGFHELTAHVAYEIHAQIDRGDYDHLVNRSLFSWGAAYEYQGSIFDHAEISLLYTEKAGIAKEYLLEKVSILSEFSKAARNVNHEEFWDSKTNSSSSFLDTSFWDKVSFYLKVLAQFDDSLIVTDRLVAISSELFGILEDKSNPNLEEIELWVLTLLHDIVDALGHRGYSNTYYWSKVLQLFKDYEDTDFFCNIAGAFSQNPEQIESHLEELLSYAKDESKRLNCRLEIANIICRSKSLSKDGAKLLLGLCEGNLNTNTDWFDFGSNLKVLGELSSLKGDNEIIQRLLNMATKQEISSRIRLDACECILKLLGKI